ncbi:ParB N-terminal domain-containing protein [Streptomyces sp. NBC_00237]|nr:ParB N-terminal domain-containing protein [Streptomyces sp. NBC_00237]MCX5206094.1 ParB N-terminal domain-containing protein [Streptomyces sp. NBC_00237]
MRTTNPFAPLEALDRPYTILHGRRRFLAAQIAGLDTVPVRIVTTLA